MFDDEFDDFENEYIGFNPFEAQKSMYTLPKLAATQSFQCDQCGSGDVPVGFERVRSDAKLTCVTGFTDYSCLKEFNFVKKIIRKSGLEGIKSLNETMAQYKNQQVA